MKEYWFFEIPIYGYSPADHADYLDKLKSKIIPEETKLKFPDTALKLEYSYYNNFHFGYKFNVIEGYLELYFVGNQFRGEIWLSDKARIRKGIVKKKFVNRGKVFELGIPKDCTSKEIYLIMLEQLIRINSEYYKKYIFDLNCFQKTGQYIDWVKMRQETLFS